MHIGKEPVQSVQMGQQVTSKANQNYSNIQNLRTNCKRVGNLGNQCLAHLTFVGALYKRAGKTKLLLRRVVQKTIS